MARLIASRTTHHVWRDGQFQPLEYPAEAEHVMNDVAARDRAWFKAHPTVTAYIRALIPGEFGACDPVGCSHVYVRKAGKFRLREPIGYEPITGGARVYFKVSERPAIEARFSDHGDLGALCRRLEGC